MSFLTAALETASEVSTVEVTSTALETITPSTGVFTKMTDTIVEHKETIALVAVTVGAAYGVYRWGVPAVRKLLASKPKVVAKQTPPKEEPVKKEEKSDVKE